MTARTPLTVLLAVAATGVAAPTAQAASCGDSPGYGITKVVATNVGCAAAKKVAERYNAARMGGSMNGWSCKGTRMTAAKERVTCRKGARRITFRSTYQVELPAASATPVTNGGGG